jgi:hypothetical protein
VCKYVAERLAGSRELAGEDWKRVGSGLLSACEGRANPGLKRKEWESDLMLVGAKERSTGDDMR